MRETLEACIQHDQAICEALLREYPHLASALCFLYGVYRGQGLTPWEAERTVRLELQSDTKETP